VYGGQAQSAVELDAARSALLFGSLGGAPSPESSAVPGTPSESAPAGVSADPIATPTAASDLTCAP
jgi:hypothetical protein